MGIVAGHLSTGLSETLQEAGRRNQKGLPFWELAFGTEGRAWEVTKPEHEPRSSLNEGKFLKSMIWGSGSEFETREL